MEIRTFAAGDGDAVRRLWNRTIEREKAGSPWYVESFRLSDERLARIFSDANFDPEGFCVARDEGTLIGLARSVVKTVKSYPEEDPEVLPAYLEGLLVEPGHRRRGVGSALLERVEEYALARGKAALRISRYRSAIQGVGVLPETPEHRFLAARGFEPEGGTELMLRLDVEKFEFRPEVRDLRRRLADEGVEIRYYEPSDFKSLERLMVRHHARWWYFNYRPILTGPNPLPMLVAVEGEHVVGFIGWVHVGTNRRAGFSPGVDLEYRGRGIGKALCNTWAEEVRRLGAWESVITVGSPNAPARKIYLDMGFQQIGEFFANMVKRLA